MSFNVERMRKVRFMPAKLSDAVTVHMVLKLNPDTVSKFVPSPLKLRSNSTGHFILNHFRATTLPGVESYLESAILLDVEFGSVPGCLTLAMLLDDDNAMIGGREFFGFPKKLAQIEFTDSSSNTSGKVERRKTILADFTCDVGDEISDYDQVPGVFGENCYNIKCFPDPSLRRFDYPPRLVRHRIEERTKRISKLVNCKLNLFSSPYDPWSEIGEFTIIEGYRREYDCTILAGEIVAELDGDEYFKHALNRFI